MQDGHRAEFLAFGPNAERVAAALRRQGFESRGNSWESVSRRSVVRFVSMIQCSQVLGVFLDLSAGFDGFIASRLIDVCCRRMVPCLRVYYPDCLSSLASVSKRLNDDNIHHVKCYSCGYGGASREAFYFCAFGLALEDLGRLTRQCRGAHSYCGFRCPPRRHSRTFTRLFPLALCDAVAFSLASLPRSLYLQV